MRTVCIAIMTAISTSSLMMMGTYVYTIPYLDRHWTQCIELLATVRNALVGWHAAFVVLACVMLVSKLPSTPWQAALLCCILIGGRVLYLMICVVP